MLNRKRVFGRAIDKTIDRLFMRMSREELQGVRTIPGIKRGV